MNWQTLEHLFNRSLRFSFSRKKIGVVFPALVVSGLLVVIFRTISHGATEWMQFTLGFLPIFLIAALLLSLGIVLTRIYHHELQGQELNYGKTIRETAPLFWGIAYLVIPLIFAYLVLWMLLGIFYLVRAIPYVGSTASAIFSFGPFLLVLASICLSLFNLGILFFIAPAVSLSSPSSSRWSSSLGKEIFSEVKTSPFSSFALPLIGIFPVLLVVAILSLAAMLTHELYIAADHRFSIALKWFFMMLPFCAVLTPAVIFFFNFSTEVYMHARKKSIEN